MFKVKSRVTHKSLVVMHASWNCVNLGVKTWTKNISHFLQF